MNALKRNSGILRALLAASAFLLSGIISPPCATALMPMPDIGVNYQTMTVIQAQKLAAVGMKNVKNGDKIFLRTSRTGQFFFKNLRTNEELTLP